MPRDISGNVTALLRDWRAGDGSSLDRLLDLVYGELKSIANRHLRSERQSHTLQPTALVHEAFLRLVEQREVSFQNRQHFFALAATMMRRVLVDHARRRGSEKRGGESVQIELASAEEVSEAVQLDEVLAVDQALDRLATLDPLRALVVELRYFGGLTNDEAAVVLGCSEPTVRRHWRLARTWLYQVLKPIP